jgi:hypothetical protein
MFRGKFNFNIKIICGFLIVAIFFVLLSSCSSDTEIAGTLKPFNINIPENAELTVSEIRVRGFTLSWINLDGDCEYAIAASYNGEIDDYITALKKEKDPIEHYPMAYDSYCREITLPVWYGLTDEMINQVIRVVIQSVEEVIGF